MSFDRNRLPDPLSYFEHQDLKLTPKGKWRSARCVFHDGSDSMRINTATGAWVCMSCAAKGGDVLAYEMATTGADFISAAKALGAWIEDGKPETRHKATPLPARQAIQVLNFESTLTAVAAGNIAKGLALTDADRARLMVAVGRINRIAEAFA
ncbi:CHC2 zinc finger domain-containing protein [Xenophilus azovorans]|uniref:CHC2 zinc finger domain-containing protein n=1 Tax=Xenophilus azovorans TaxID=151755 RepID=UPI00056E9933|nr:CHC2 zinc finger domain-containing protein [Xenophilus azovorans]